MKRKNHKYTYSVMGVPPYSGRPHGVDETWTCEHCGARRSRGPENTCSGGRVVRWRYADGNGNPVDVMPSCTHN